ncbi:MAG TPA: antibiotic biosynthesis monooxygenase [Anaerolineales bacterium]|nr:antibiotic biosynthesis monooxygenase [Anaerolineales bacterium]
MFVIIWEFKVKPEKQNEFEKAYAPNGIWAELFKKSAAYWGTELLCDETRPYRYLTIDRWASKEVYEAFLLRREKEYKALDTQCEGLTESESLLGKWDSA